jgi:hypothetical protein
VKTEGPGAAQRLKAKEDFSAALKAEPVRSAKERSQVLLCSLDHRDGRWEGGVLRYSSI